MLEIKCTHAVGGGDSGSKGRCASEHWHTHSLLGYGLIDTAPLDVDQVLPSCCSHTCLLAATWLGRIKALINLGYRFPFKTSPPLALICLHRIWSLVRLLTAPLNYTVGPDEVRPNYRPLYLTKGPGPQAQPVCLLQLTHTHIHICTIHTHPHLRAKPWLRPPEKHTWWNTSVSGLCSQLTNRCYQVVTGIDLEVG